MIVVKENMTEEETAAALEAHKREMMEGLEASAASIRTSLNEKTFGSEKERAEVEKYVEAQLAMSRAISEVHMEIAKAILAGDVPPPAMARAFSFAAASAIYTLGDQYDAVEPIAGVFISGFIDAIENIKAKAKGGGNVVMKHSDGTVTSVDEDEGFFLSTHSRGTVN